MHKGNVGYPTLVPVGIARKVLQRRTDTDARQSVAGYVVPYRRIEDRIRELCARLTKAEDKDFELAISDLKAALHDHTEQLRKLVAESLLKRRPNRRKID